MKIKFRQIKNLQGLILRLTPYSHFVTPNSILFPSCNRSYHKAHLNGYNRLAHLRRCYLSQVHLSALPFHPNTPAVRETLWKASFAHHFTPAREVSRTGSTVLVMVQETNCAALGIRATERLSKDAASANSTPIGVKAFWFSPPSFKKTINSSRIVVLHTQN